MTVLISNSLLTVMDIIIMFVFLCRWQQCCWHPTEGLCKYVLFSPHTHVPLMIMCLICLPIPSLSSSLFLFSLFLFIFLFFLLSPLLLLLSSPFSLPYTLSTYHLLFFILSTPPTVPPSPFLTFPLSSTFPLYVQMYSLQIIYS